MPAGLYYRAKRTFRSAALLHFGRPFTVEPVPLAPGEEPPSGSVRALTAQIEGALADVTLQAEHAEVHALVARAHRIVSAEDEAPPAPRPLETEFALRRRLLAGYAAVRALRPERLAALASRLDRYEAALAAAGLDAAPLAPRAYRVGRVVGYALRAVGFFVLVLPTALCGVVVHYLPYRAVGFVATGVAHGADDVLASVKVLAAMLVFPLTWAGVAAAVGLWRGPPAGALALIIAPLTGYAALRFFERLDHVAGAARGLGLFLFRRWAFLRLVAERNAIQEEIRALGRDIGALPASSRPAAAAP